MLSQPQCGLENHVIESMSGWVFCSKQAVSRVAPYKDPKDTLSFCSLFYVNEHPRDPMARINVASFHKPRKCWNSTLDIMEHLHSSMFHYAVWLPLTQLAFSWLVQNQNIGLILELDEKLMVKIWKVIWTAIEWITVKFGRYISPKSVSLMVAWGDVVGLPSPVGTIIQHLGSLEERARLNNFAPLQLSQGLNRQLAGSAPVCNLYAPQNAEDPGNYIPRKQSIFWLQAPLSSFNWNEWGSIHNAISRISWLDGYKRLILGWPKLNNAYF